MCEAINTSLRGLGGQVDAVFTVLGGAASVSREDMQSSSSE